jgi:WD40 repeat protein
LSRTQSGDTVVRSHILEIRNKPAKPPPCHLQRVFETIPVYLAIPNMATNNSFHHFSHGHHDLVLAVDYNFYGTRMVTASSDHRLKVWDKKDDGWTVTDVWKAHDAEVTDVSHC